MEPEKKDWVDRTPWWGWLAAAFVFVVGIAVAAELNSMWRYSGERGWRMVVIAGTAVAGLGLAAMVPPFAFIAGLRLGGKLNLGDRSTGLCALAGAAGGLLATWTLLRWCEVLLRALW
jgi:hypothetical protein